MGDFNIRNAVRFARTVSHLHVFEAIFEFRRQGFIPQPSAREASYSTRIPGQSRRTGWTGWQGFSDTPDRSAIRHPFYQQNFL